MRWLVRSVCRLLGAAAFGLFERVHRLGLRWLGATRCAVRTTMGAVHVLHVPGRGPLPSVVVLPGLSSSSIDFAPLIRRLRPHVRRVVALDCPGHGRSPRRQGATSPATLQAAVFETLEALRGDALDEPFALVGSSLGGWVATRYARRHPDALRHLVLVAPAGAPCSPETLAALRRRFLPDTFGDGLRFVREVFVRRRWYERVIAWGVPRRVATPTARSLLAGYNADTWLRPRELQTLQGPVRLLWGGRDVVLPAQHLEFFARHLPPQARCEVHEDWGHAPHLDDPARLAAAVLEALRDTRVRARANQAKSSTQRPSLARSSTRTSVASPKAQTGCPAQVKRTPSSSQA